MLGMVLVTAIRPFVNQCELTLARIVLRLFVVAFSWLSSRVPPEFPQHWSGDAPELVSSYLFTALSLNMLMRLFCYCQINWPS